MAHQRLADRTWFAGRFFVLRTALGFTLCLIGAGLFLYSLFDQ